MTIVPFDPNLFRATYKQFGNAACFTDSILEGYWATATNYVTPVEGAIFNFSVPEQTQAVNLMTAHIAAIFDALQNNKPLGVVTDAAIDKVRITVKPPPFSQFSQFSYWLSLTPYGVMLMAMFNTASAGGFYFGGLPERDGFRRVGGGFGGLFPGG